ncbi:MAG TPA: FeoB small GTPase domain-containing protein [Spirochaetia bacterium]|nr:FeoB small GTPase domain-containing protein [Spirochaetales bacterium]HRY78964.1 FeoB small GTPase domain-containing protein [Spirochaetia bacterium]HRZ89574.1 FeoB small GTPase domain-containing protein [Spirochaetia bacterium]
MNDPGRPARGPGRGPRGGFRNRGARDAAVVRIVGLPNAGKSALYNALTGAYSVVANYPNTTVDPERTIRREGGVPVRYVDEPGVDGLAPESEDARLLLDRLLSERTDLLLFAADARRLESGLALLWEFLFLGIPTVLVLTGIDEAPVYGVEVEYAALSRLLGVPVAAVSSEEGRGIPELRSRVRTLLSPAGAAGTPRTGGEAASVAPSPPPEPPLPPGIRDARETVRAALAPGVRSPGAAALFLLRADPDLARAYPGAGRTAAVRTALLGLPLERLLSRGRTDWARRIVRSCARIRGRRPGSAADRLAALARHPLWGLPVLGALLLSAYFLVMYASVDLAGWMDSTLAVPAAAWVADRIASPGIRDFLVGDFGLLTLGVFNALCTVLPILAVFYLFFGIIEDSGYLPNLIVLSRTALGRIGLSGRSVLPVILGFGCKTMATLSARSIPDRKERTIAVFLIAFGIPCSAQLGLNMAILARAGTGAFLIALGFLSAAELGAGAVLNRLLPGESRGGFVLELPPFRVPDPGALLRKTGWRLARFVREALPVFAAAAVALYLADGSGILGAFRDFLAPLVSGWLGLPPSMADALILSMARHEAAAGLILGMAERGLLDRTAMVVSVTVTTLFVPCAANIVAIVKELGKRRGAAVVLAANALAITLGGALNGVLRFLGF